MTNAIPFQRGIWLAAIPDCTHLLAGERRVAAYIIDGGRCASKATLMDQWASVLAFPEYFGRNWDAFDECLSDLSWLPPSPRCVVVTNADALLDLPKSDFGSLVGSLGRAVRESEYEMMICLCSSYSNTQQLRASCEEVGVSVCMLPSS